MKELSPAHHVEALKRAVGDFVGATFRSLPAIPTDQALVQAYQDYVYEAGIMTGMDSVAANLRAISRAERFTDELPALKLLFTQRLKHR